MYDAGRRQGFQEYEWGVIDYGADISDVAVEVYGARFEGGQPTWNASTGVVSVKYF